MASSTVSVAARLPCANTRPAAKFVTGLPATLSRRSTNAPLARRSGVVKAEKKAPSSPDVEKIIKDLTDKWDDVEDKSSVLLIGAGAIALLWVTTSVVNAVNGLPLLPKFLELVGLVYSAWFVYRYLLFKSSREELIADIDELKKKISGDA